MYEVYDVAETWNPKKLKLLREERGLTQQELGDEWGITQQQIGKWETSTSPHSKRINFIAAYFDVSPAWLLDMTPYRNPVVDSDLTPEQQEALDALRTGDLHKYLNVFNRLNGI